MRIAMMLQNTISENATAPNPEAKLMPNLSRPCSHHFQIVLANLLKVIAPRIVFVDGSQRARS